MRLNKLALAFALIAVDGPVQAFAPPGDFSSSLTRPTHTRLLAKNKGKETPKKVLSPIEAAQEPPTKTLGGGENLLFAMARRMLVWGEEGGSATTRTATATTKPTTTPPRPIMPRWHPHAGISDVNPSFRTQAPIMNNQGYAGVIWRNVRKRDKPSLWRHSLRAYERMKAIELNPPEKSSLNIFRSNIHYEGALLACAKLAKWREALEIYHDVVANESTTENLQRRQQLQVQVTDNMVLSLITACVRGCKQMDGREFSVEQRRAPLDACRDVVLELEEKHALPLVALHINPLAAAYQSLGLITDASRLLKENLTDRASGPEDEDGDDPFNIHDISAKNKASYALLVKGAVSQGDWAGAVEALRDMTEAGSFPSSRNLNAWTEVSERKTRQRNTRSRKKKRDEFWLESVR